MSVIQFPLSEKTIFYCKLSLDNLKKHYETNMLFARAEQTEQEVEYWETRLQEVSQAIKEISFYRG